MDNAQNRISADTGVHIVDKSRGLDIKGMRGTFNLGTEEGTISGSPELKVGNDKPMTVTSQEIELSRPRHYALATGDVKAVTQDVQLNCDTLRYFLEQDSALAHGHPVMTQSGNTVSGDGMRFHFDSTNLRRIDVSGDGQLPKLVRKQDSLTGREIVIRFQDGRVSSIDVQGDSARQPELHQELNLAKGDSIRFQFRNDTVDMVRIAGRTSGTYFTDGGDRIEVTGTESVIHFEQGEAKLMEIANVTEGRLYRHDKGVPGSVPSTTPAKSEPARTGVK